MGKKVDNHVMWRRLVGISSRYYEDMKQRDTVYNSGLEVLWLTVDIYQYLQL